MSVRLLTKAIQVMAFGAVLLSGSAAMAAPDAALGKTKAALCLTCHAENGMSSIPDTPHLAAQPALSIFYQLLQFRDQRRKGGNMETLVKDLSETDMRDIAAFFAALPPPPGLKGEDQGLVAQGQRLAQQHYCSSCHGAKLQGQKHVPRLSGQATAYFSVQLRRLRSGERADMDGTMASAAKALSDQDIEALAVYARSLD